jgi:hypothetical protein
VNFLLRRSPDLAPADVRLEAPSRSFELTFRRPTLVLGRWPLWRTVTRRYVVRALPMSELIALHQRMGVAAAAHGGLSEAQAVAFVIRSADAMFMSPEQVSAVWTWYCEVNRLGDPKARAAEEPHKAPAASDSLSSPSPSSGGPSDSMKDASSP